MACILLLGGGILAWMIRRRPIGSALAGSGAVVAGSAVALAGSWDVLLGGPAQSARIPWSLPLGSGFLGLDALSAWFLTVLLVVSSIVAIYGAGYLRSEEAHRRTGGTWLAFDVLVASMMLVVAARDGVTFLAAWEIMALSSFALVVFDHPEAQVRRAGFIYLVAGQLGTACLLAFFLILDDGSGRLAFPLGNARIGTTLPFLLAFLGFGLKAGFHPLHVWLPEAHASAPSHVSALMSGVLLKMGVYGLLRAITLLESPPPLAVGLLILAAGFASGLMGVLHALAQHDLKRLLAYHSVENLGIIALGLGLSLVGQATGMTAVAWLGMASALLHVLNHAVFKPLLFMGAGAVLRAAGTRRIDRLGGLFRRMPRTAPAFLVGAAAISGLPPFNGFASEFLLFVAGFQGLGGGAVLRASSLGVIGGMALIGGLAAACFAKVVGVVFLGEPRSPEAAAVREVPATMWGPMWALALACLAVGIFPAAVLALVAPAVNAATGLPGRPESMDPARILELVGWIGVGLIGLSLLLWALRRLADRGRGPATAPTWDCGYAAVTPRMQYTASSFARPLLEDLGRAVDVRVEREGPEGYFPPPGRLEVHASDRVLTQVLEPAFRGAARLLGMGRRLQRGRVQEYLLVLLMALVALLLVWKEV